MKISIHFKNQIYFHHKPKSKQNEMIGSNPIPERLDIFYSIADMEKPLFTYFTLSQSKHGVIPSSFDRSNHTIFGLGGL